MERLPFFPGLLANGRREPAGKSLPPAGSRRPFANIESRTPQKQRHLTWAARRVLLHIRFTLILRPLPRTRPCDRSIPDIEEPMPPPDFRLPEDFPDLTLPERSEPVGER